MTDKPTIIDGVDVSQCKIYSSERVGYCGWYVPCEGRSCFFKIEQALSQLKQSEQNAQDTYDMFKACIQSLEIARKQLSDEQQKVYQIGKICEEYSVNYVTNTGVQLMINKITDIIGDKTNE